MVRVKTNFDYAESDYAYLNSVPDKLQFKDRTLVMYEQDFYVEMDNEEFLEIVDSSEQLIAELRTACEEFV